jgi:tetratricopeptide (TPR) repeat protein
MRILCTILLFTSFALAQTGVPDYSKLSPKELETRADAFRSQREIAAALELYRRAIARDPKNAVLYNKAGMAQLILRDYEGARRSFERATKLQKDFAEAINNLGVVYYQRRDYRRAAQLYKKAIKLRPESSSFHLNLGSAYFDDKQLEAAMKEYGEALQLDPLVFERSSAFGISAKVSKPEERAVYAYMMARLYARANDVDHAIAQLRSAMEDGYPNIRDVYTSNEFANVRQDPRFAELMQSVPPALP